MLDRGLDLGDQGAALAQELIGKQLSGQC